MVYNLAVISSNKASAKFLSHGYLEAQGLTPIWCEYDISDISNAKRITDYFYVLLPDEKDIKLDQICHFLFDICIEEDKTVYLFGSQRIMPFVTSIIPKLFVSGVFIKGQIEVYETLKIISKDIKVKSALLPNILLLDDNPEYFQELAAMLKNDFNTYLRKPNIEDTLKYIKSADIIIMSLNMKMEIIDQTLLMDMILKQQKRRTLNLIFITNKKSDQKNINLLNIPYAICLSKEIPSNKIANYIINRYSVNAK